ncbi:hypothetical protein TNCV_161181 [Trichonephila clavipes]|nr:hypothetical protein TNCV_161181 [Trichonephila clavipes]
MASCTWKRNCSLGRQLPMARPSMGMGNRNPSVIQLFTYPWSSLDVAEPTVGLVDNKSLSIEAHEWTAVQSHNQQCPLDCIF